MSGDIPYAGPRLADAALLTIDEVRAAEVTVPPGTYPYTVQPGDNLWKIAVNTTGQDPPDMNAFYAQNPQYSNRNPDEVYPGEVVLANVPQNGTVPTGGVDALGQPEYQNYQAGSPAGEPYGAETAPNGMPANSEVVRPDGTVIRTDASGEPFTGTYRGTVEDGQVGGDPAYRSFTQEYVDGVPVGPRHFASGRMV